MGLSEEMIIQPWAFWVGSRSVAVPELPRGAEQWARSAELAVVVVVAVLAGPVVDTWVVDIGFDMDGPDNMDRLVEAARPAPPSSFYQSASLSRTR